MKNITFWKEYLIDCSLLNNFTIKNGLSIFWNEVMSDLPNNQNVYINLKVKFSDGSYASISKMQTVNKTMFKDLLDIFKGYIDLKLEDYSSKTISQIIFQYHIVLENNNIKPKLPRKFNKVAKFNFGGYSFPLTMELNKWGNIISEINNQIIIKKESSILTYHITKETLKHFVKVYFNDKLILQFIDKVSLSLTDFDRIIDNHLYKIRDGKQVLKKITKKTKFLDKIKLDKSISNKFITLDIETRNVNGIMTPYCISYFDGLKATSFYLSDFNNCEDMLLKAIISLMRYSYNGYKIYIHNLSNFDGIFLLKHLSDIPQSILTPIIKDGKMISITFSWFATERSLKSYNIEFRDSLLMLPNSIAKLAKAFQVEDPISFNSLKSLLLKDSKLDLNQEKWFKSISDGSISVKNQIYSLMATDNKRQLIYDKHMLLGTKPYTIDNSKELK
jgi:hypothetical protein